MDPTRFFVAIIGDNMAINNGLRDMHEYGRPPSLYYESMEREETNREKEFEKQRYLAICNTWHEIGEYRGSFGCHSIVLLTYDVSNMASLQYLEGVYETIPQPEEHRDFEGVFDLKDHTHWVRAPKTRGLHLKPMEGMKSVEKGRPGYMAMEHYPVVIAGCRFENRPRQVHESDIQNFIWDRPDCVFGGEFALENLEEIDAVFQVVVGIIHGLRKMATKELPSSEELVPIVKKPAPPGYGRSSYKDMFRGVLWKKPTPEKPSGLTLAERAGTVSNIKQGPIVKTCMEFSSCN